MKFVLTDIDYDDSIRLFGETIDGKKIVIKDEKFKPYFYSKKKPPKIKINENEIIKIKKEKDKYKIILNSIKSISTIREYLHDYKLIEYDIPIIKRYLIDKGLTMLEGVNDNFKKCEIKWKPKVLAIDIETTNKKGVVNSSIDEVIMISLWSNYGIKKVMVSKKYKHKYVEDYPNEKEMLIAFNNLINKTKPSIIITYNGDNFDWPFLRDRMNKYGISRNYGYDNSPMTIIKKRTGSSARIKGLSHIDLYVFILKILSNQLKTNSLDLKSVSKELINNTKKDMDWEEFYDNWENNKLDKIIDYSLTDAKITYELFDKLKPIIFELTKLVNLPLYDASRSSYSSLVENYLINRAKEFNEEIPPRPTGSDIMSRRMISFTGGYVHEPVAGVYENIAVVDFRSLYPTIIVSYNIGPETINKKGIKIKINGKCHEFGQDKKGFIPQVVKDLVEKRAKIKKELKKQKNPLLEARSYAIKTITNAIYGYLSYPRSRWYCFDCAESITALGRKHIKEVIDEAIKEGFDVCYGDTDSAFLTLGNKNKKDLLIFLEKINKKLPGIMELELERFCKRGLFVSGKKGEKGIKKRYVLLDENNKLIIKGFEFVRGDWSLISKETQYKVFNALLKDNNKNKAINIVKEVINNLRENKISLKKLIITTQLTRNINEYKSIGPHVAVAKRLIKKGWNITAGTMIKYVIVKGKGLMREKARTPEEVIKENLTPDAEYYIYHQVIPAVERVLDALKVNENDLEGKQKGLRDYF